MRYSLGSLTSLGSGTAPDLRKTLEERLRTQRDLRLPVEDLEVESGRIRFGAESASIDGDAADALERLDGEVLLRLEGDRVRGILPGRVRLVSNLELVDTTLACLAKVPHEIKTDICEEQDGDLHVALVAPGLARDVRPGDYLYGGLLLTNSETTLQDTEACVRIFRVQCRNGALADAAEGQRLVLPRIVERGAPDPYPTWQARLATVVENAFDGGALDAETQRLRAATDEMLASPYEFLLHLAAQGLIDEDEQERIQRAFDEAGDASLYGLVNAVTSIAHGLRGRDEWIRSFAMERLGGEIARGDHQPPVGSPVFA